MPPDPRVHVGVAAIVTRDGSLLMLQRRGDFGHQQWSVPGGWIEHDDATIEAAATRETREETRVWVDGVAAAGHTLHNMLSQDGTIRMDVCVTCFVVCRWVDGEPVNAEPAKAEVVEWVPLDEVGDRVLFDPLRQWWDANGTHLMAVGA